MNRIVFFLRPFFIVSCISIPLFSAQQGTDSSLTPTLKNIEVKKSATQKLSEVLFLGLPTQSSNAERVDAMFGSKGLNLDAQLVDTIKKFYFYLEYVAKIERAARLVELAEQHNIDVHTFLDAKVPAWQGLIDAVTKAAGSAEKLRTELATKSIKPAWRDVKLSVTSWQEVLTTPLWKAINLTGQDLQESQMWQEYLAYAIFAFFNQDEPLLGAITQTETRIFPFIPNIEVAYYHPDFTTFRIASELYRVNLIVTDNIRNRFVRQAVDLKQFISSNQEIDLGRTYSWVRKTVKEDPVISFILAKEKEGAVKILESAAQTDPQLAKLAQTSPLATEKITIFAMIKALQALTANLFETEESIAKTMALLKSKNNVQPQFLLYAPEDELYLADRANIIAQMKKNPTSVVTASADTVHLVEEYHKKQIQLAQHGAIAHADDIIIQGFWDDLWSAAKKGLQGGLDIGKGLGQGALGAGEWLGSLFVDLGGAIVSIFDPAAGEALLKKAAALQKNASDLFDQAGKNIHNGIDEVADSARGFVHIGGEAVANVIGLFDKKLGKDVEGALEAMADIVISTLANMTHTFVASVGGVIRLSLDVIQLAADTISDTIASTRLGSKIFAEHAYLSVKNLAADTVSTLLDTVTFWAKITLDVFKDLMKLVAYVTSIVTDLFIDLETGLTYIMAGFAKLFGANIDPAAVAGQVNQALEDHRKTIDAVVNTAILVAATVATDGLALPAIAMTAGPQLLTIGGAEQESERTMAAKAEQKTFLQNYKTHVEKNKIMVVVQEELWAGELGMTYSSEASNQERELGFYQNFLSENFEHVKDNMSNTLGGFLATTVTPDSDGVVLADVGSIYGFNTNVYNFNPSQGFSLYNKARNTFSQEIAVSPVLLTQEADDQNPDKETPEKFWFNQRETILQTAPLNSVEIRWRAIYTLTSFYIGLYFGGQPYNIEDIKKTKRASIDASHLAKMLVYYKTGKNGTPQLGLYEHESNLGTQGWISAGIAGAPAFMPGVWYRMSMSLSGDSLTVKTWREDMPKVTQQTFKVTIENNNPPKTLGVISSGASIEYEVITPPASIQAVPGKRIATSQTEKKRELTKLKAQEELLNPVTLQPFKLAPAHMADIIRGNYVYQTQDTKLQDANKKNLEDYVLLCYLQKDDFGKYTINSIGGNPTDGFSGIVSVVSGNAFIENSSSPVATFPDTYSSYIKQHPLSDTLTAKIEVQRKLYLSPLLQQFTFGTLKLEPTGLEEINKGLYLYKGTTLSPELKDAKGTSLTDYYLMAELDPEKKYITKYNIPYTNGTPAIVSVISGNVYLRGQTQSIVQGYKTILEDIEIPLRPEISAAIKSTRDIFEKNSSPNQRVPLTPVKPITNSTVKPGDIAKPQPTGGQAGQTIPNPGTPQQSLQQTQEDAKGREEEATFG